MDRLPVTKRSGRVLAAIAGIAGVVVLTACSHAMPSESGGPRTAAGDDDAWISQGSVGAGPVIGKPVGPYIPR